MRPILSLLLSLLVAVAAADPGYVTTECTSDWPAVSYDADFTAPLALAAPRRIGDVSALRSRLIADATRSVNAQGDSASLALLDGWVDLIDALQAVQNTPKAVLPALQEWLQRYPQHPAAATIRPLVGKLPAARGPQQVAAKPALPGRLQRAAVLLPFSGPWGGAADAVRRGMSAAQAAMPRADAPELLFVDTEQGLAAAYRSALAFSPDIVVGPLLRENLDLLLGLNPTVPVLSLNYLEPGPARPGLYQFGLAPEDEARAVADLARQRHLGCLVLLYPEDGWGERLFEAFAGRWRALNGCLLGADAYPGSGNDFRGVIRDLLGLNGSFDRHRKLQAVVGRHLEFQPRRRNDLDGVVMLAGREKARQLRPQLAFWYAQGLPVLSTSHVWDGRNRRLGQHDLDGLTLVDMPWTLWPGGNDGDAEGFPRLYALGLDSMEVLPWLAQGADGALVGSSGVRLWMDTQGRIHRQLAVAKVRAGMVRPVCTMDR